MNTSSMNSHENGKLHIRKITWLKSGNLSWHVTGMDLLEPHLPGRKGLWGGLARDNCQFINVVFWILRTGTSWRDFPPLVMAVGAILIAALFVGETKESGSCYWKNW